MSVEDELKRREVNIDIYWWLLFFVLSITNGILSYTSFAIETKGSIFLFGIILPLYLAVRVLPPSKPFGESFSQGKDIPFFPAAGFAVLSVAAILSRFYRLQTFHLWPSGDE